MQTYLHSMLIALVLVGALAVQWRLTERPLSSLGLGVPVSAPALAGLGIALCVLIGLAVVIIVRPQGERTDHAVKEIVPQTRAEMIVFIAFSLAMGCAWELLYRGYLLWFLPARLGLPASVLVAALAYGLAHGFKSVKAFAASLIAALAFTVAFALTKSLWWLMLLHSGLPFLLILAFQRQKRFTSDEPRSGAPSPELAAP
jgi:membrane protease YdiL (CAAX protease family)